MVEKETLLTREGLRKLEEELEYLKTVKRQEIAERLKQAIEFGDISENSEYEDAKNEQAFVEGRILTLEKILRTAKIIDYQEASGETISVGTKVTLRDLDSREKFQYEIVGSMEADPCVNRISNESPVGKALLGHKVGDVVEIEVPEGTIRYQITHITRA